MPALALRATGIVVLGVSILAGALRLHAATEYQVKAAFLLTFARFVRWPKPVPKQGSFVIGIFGRDPFAGELERIANGRKADGQPVAIQRFSDAKQAVKCRVLYVSESEEHRVSGVLEVFGRRPVLLVSDISDFAGRGGAIGLVLDEGRVRFEVNHDSLTRAGISVDSQLLALARAVRKGPRGVL